ncbi:hypothetical protein EDD22DRAFT_524429 [Suillus occidentalis]|nr:hypothetical protein EDD22DRAFT_524429 [Suillus occidentalis]
MSLSLSVLTCVLALRSLEVAASAVYLPVPAFMLERGNGGNGNGPSSTTTSTTTSSTSSKHQSSTTDSSNTHTSSSPTTTRSSSTITQPSSTLTTQSSSTSTSTPTPTGTVTSSNSGDAITTSSSSGSATNNAYGSTSAASQGLSTSARTGLAFGIMFFLILSAMLVCYLRRRSRIAREKAFDRPAPLSSEVSQHHPPAPGAPPERELSALPPTRLNPAYTNISRSRHSANSSISPLLSDSSRASYPASTWNRYSTFSQESDTRPIIMEDIPPLPNPHDPPSASARTVSHASATPANSYDASVLASAATTRSFSALAGSSSNSRGAPVLNAPRNFNSVSEAARAR